MDVTLIVTYLLILRHIDPYIFDHTSWHWNVHVMNKKQDPTWDVKTINNDLNILPLTDQIPRGPSCAPSTSPPSCWPWLAPPSPRATRPPSVSPLPQKQRTPCLQQSSTGKPNYQPQQHSSGTADAPAAALRTSCAEPNRKFKSLIPSQTCLLQTVKPLRRSGFATRNVQPFR